ncbi:MAG: hypothetical protein OEU95_02220 [Nitrospirota bacterium]|nr:hypothetical protein [Nitrospirota bacterium]
MKRQITVDRSQLTDAFPTFVKEGFSGTTIFLIVFAFVLLLWSSASADNWAGVDESVVEKFAQEHGREAAEPLINTDQGDLLLFVFLLAGAVGGFAGGYYWRMLTEKGTGTCGSPAIKKE